MIDLKLTKKRLALHWHYYYWRYIVIVGAALLAANLLFSGTAPKAPPERRIDVIIVSPALMSTDAEEWKNDLTAVLPPDQQEVNVTTTMLSDDQQSTIYQLVAARMAAGEGNVWIMPKDLFRSYAESGAFVPLDSDLSKYLIPEGINLAGGTVTVKTDDGKPGEKHIYGIPLDKFPGMAEVFQPADMVMAICINADKNMENSIAAVNWLLTKTGEPLPPASTVSKQYVSIPVLAYSFRAANADAWRKDLAAAAGVQGAGVPLKRLSTGRESFSAGVIASEIKQGQGNAWIVPQSVFLPLVQAGVLRALDNDVASFGVPEGTDLSLGKAAVVKNGKAGDTHQYGIPLDQSAGLAKVTAPEGLLLVFPAWGDNDYMYDATRRAAQWLAATDLAPEKPAGAAK